MAVWIIIILAVLLTLYGINVNKKKEKETVGEAEVLLSDIELKHLKVYCSTCGDTEVKAGSTIKAIENKGCFSVKGFNAEGKETVLLASKVSWNSSCQVCKWENDIGIRNCVSCNNGLIRSVWIKYSNGVTFNWKIDFGKQNK
jgi:hypothetical protein